MIISTISRGRLVALDDCAVGVSGEPCGENSCVILALPRYQTRITSSSIAVVGWDIQKEHQVVNIRAT